MGKISRSIMENVSWMQFLEMCFPLKMFCCSVNPPWFSREKQKYSARRETDPDDFFSPGFEVLWYCSFVERQRAKPGHAWVASDNYGTDHNFISINTHSHGQKVHLYLKTRFHSQSQNEREIVDSMDHSHYIDLISTNTPHPHTTFAARLPTSYSDSVGWKHYVFPHSIRCLSILAEVSMSLQTQRGWVRRKVHQREIPSVSSSILLVWTWANSLLSPPWQPFSLQTGRPFESTHTLNQGPWRQTQHPLMNWER